MIGHIHYERLLTMFHLLLTKDFTYRSHFLIPAFDYTINPLTQTLSTFNRFINSNNSISSSSNSLRESGNTIGNVLHELLIKGRQACHITPLTMTLTNECSTTSSLLYPTNDLLVHWDNIWRDFLAENCLQACRLIVIGPPKTGKTDHAKSLATR